MEIHEQRTGDAVVLALVGRLTVSDKTGLLKDAVMRHLAAGARHILIELADVVYIDSTRLGDLIATHIAVTKQGGRLTLVRVPPRVAALLSLAGLDPLFEQQSSLEAALSHEP